MADAGGKGDLRIRITRVQPEISTVECSEAPASAERVTKGDRVIRRRNKFSRKHAELPFRDLKDKKLKGQLQRRHVLQEEATERAAVAELLLQEEEIPAGIDVSPLEKTYSLRQADLLRHVDRGTRAKVLSLDLTYGPYVVDYSRSGRHLLMGGSKGSLSLLDAHTVNLLCEINVKETVRDVKFLHNHTLWAAAQKKYLYIYDQQGIELHCLRDIMLPYRLEFLPYHFLLVSVGEFGELTYLDVSTGTTAARHKTKKGACACMRQNPTNAVIHLGHSSGVVSLWTPNMGKAAAEIFCHSGRVTTVDVQGHYMATAGVDGAWKVWDLRMYRPVHEFYYFGSPPACMRFSQRGLLAIGNGSHLQIWKDATSKEKPKNPFLVEQFSGQQVESCCFQPFEDILCVGTTEGVRTLLSPGSAFVNFDSFEANPFQTVKQRREEEVHALLEKLPPDMISLNLSTSKVGDLSKKGKGPRLQEEGEQEGEEKGKEGKQEGISTAKHRKKMRGRDAPSKVQKKKVLLHAQLTRKSTAVRLAAAKKKGSVKNKTRNEVPTKYNVLDRFRRKAKPSHK